MGGGGLVYATLGRHAEAAEAFSSAVRIDPRNVEANAKLCLEYVYLGRKAEALQQYEILKNLSPREAAQISDMLPK